MEAQNQHCRGEPCRTMAGASRSYHPSTSLRQGYARQAGLRMTHWMMAFVGIVSCVLLTGCAPIERQQARVKGWWAQLTGTASGAITVTRETVEGTVEVGKQAVEGAQEMLQDLQDRTAKVQEGIEKMQEGKKLLEEGVK
ncbi:MAG: hypothetical protein ABIG34_03450 [Candidatus Peregrinibacteria bacterium]